MLRLLAPAAEIRFQNVPVGPYHGIEAIRSAFVDNPPDDTLVIVGPIRENSDGTTADYGWSADPDRIAAPSSARSTRTP